MGVSIRSMNNCRIPLIRLRHLLLEYTFYIGPRRIPSLNSARPGFLIEISGRGQPQAAFIAHARAYQRAPEPHF